MFYLIVGLVVGLVVCLVLNIILIFRILYIKINLKYYEDMYEIEKGYANILKEHLKRRPNDTKTKKSINRKI